MKAVSTWAFLHCIALPAAIVYALGATRALGNNDSSLGDTSQTEYGTRAPTSSAPSPTLRDESSQEPGGVFKDIALGIALMMSPFVAACLIRAFFSWCRRICEKRRPAGTLAHDIYEVTPGQQHEGCTSQRSHALVVGCPSSLTPQTKSKSVTWQSPFDTRARTSRRSHATGDLRFVMITTPEKTTSTRGSRGNRASPGLPRPPRPTTNHVVPKFCLEQLDSLSSSSASGVSPSVSVLVDCSSPVPMLQDNGEYDSDSPRISMSSTISDDPELAAKLDASLRWTQENTQQTANEVRGLSKLLHCSSSLHDFRHDIHHESGHGETEPELITRSSEYSF